MPIARGIMQMDRFTIHPTTTTLTITPTSPISCADTDLMEFIVNVTSTSGIVSGSISGVDVQIKNIDTNEVVAQGLLDGYGAATLSILVPISSGSKNFAAFYLGKLNQFAPSTSARKVYIVTSVSTTTTTIAPEEPYYFCKNSDFTIGAHVISSLGPPTGFLTFIIWNPANDGYVLGNTLLDGYGDGYMLIPEGILPDSTNVYVQALYLGNICYASSFSPAGTSGMELEQTSSNTTITTISIVGSSTFCIDDPLIVNATVTVTNFPNPDFGLVTFFATKNGTTTPFQVGSTVLVNSGLASITLPSNTFVLSDIYFLHAEYSGDGFCFNSSNSPYGTSGLIINPVICS